MPKMDGQQPPTHHGQASPPPDAGLEAPPVILPPAKPGPAAAGSAGSSSVPWPVVVGILAAVTVGVVTVGALATCLLAGLFWYASGSDALPDGPLDPAAQPLIAELKSDEPASRAAAADGLAALGPGARSAVADLQAQLNDQEDAPRHSAAKALARITGKPQTVKRETSRRYVGRQNERQVGDHLEWEDVWEVQWRMETVYPDGDAK